MDTILIITQAQERITNQFVNMQRQLRFLCTETLERAAVLLEDSKIQAMIMDCTGELEQELAFLNLVSQKRPGLEAILLVDVEKFIPSLDSNCRNLCRILKPLNHDELMEALERALSKVQHSDIKKITGEPMILLRQDKRFFIHLLKGMINTGNDGTYLTHIPTTFDYLNNQKVLPILFTLRRWAGEFSEQEQDKLLFGVQTLCKKKLIQTFGGTTISQMPQTLLVLIYGDFLPHQEELRLICEEISVQSERCFLCDVSAYLGRPCLAHELRKQVDVLWDGDRQNVTNPQGFFSLSQITVRREFLSKPDPKNWMYLFNNGKREEYLQCVREYFDQNIAANRMDGTFLLVFQLDFIQEIGFALKQAGIPAHEVFLQLEGTESKRQSIRSVSDMLLWVQQIVDSAMSQMKIAAGEGTIGQRVCHFLQQNLNQPFSRKDLSECLHLSESHIARAFREEMGMSIATYLAEQRIGLAKDMLKSSSLSVSTVAERAGFKEYSHFYKTFKKVTGLSPAQYRSKEQ
jgi:two-component system response regulator YesN